MGLTAPPMGTGFSFDAGGVLTGGAIPGLEVWGAEGYNNTIMIGFGPGFVLLQGIDPTTLTPSDFAYGPPSVLKDAVDSP